MKSSSWKHFRDLFRFSLDDFFISGLGMFGTLCIWLMAIRCCSLDNVLNYWDAVNLHISLKKDEILRLYDPFLTSVGVSADRAFSPFPLHYLLMKLLTFCFLGNMKAAKIAIVLVQSALCPLFMHRLLVVHRLSSRPYYSTALFIFFPLRFLFMRAVPTADSLFFCLCCATLISFKVGNIWTTTVCTIFASLTMPPGFLLFFALAFASYKTGSIKNGHTYALFGGIALLLVCQISPSWIDYLEPNTLHPKHSPVFPMLGVFSSISYIHPLKSLMVLYLLLFCGGLRLIDQSPAVCAFIVLHGIVLAFLYAYDPYRSSLTVISFAVFGGLDKVIHKSSFRFAILLCFPFYVFYALYWTSKQAEMHQMEPSLRSLL